MTEQQQAQQPAVVPEDGTSEVAAADNAGAAGSAGATGLTSTDSLSSPGNGIGAAKPRAFKMSDEFLMFKFKIEMCSRKDRHDWKICPYAHPGEVARRRHPRGYTAVLCPAKTAASCPRREQCTFAHNPFEFWLHPDRFKTSLCNQGPTCDRPICFFAHKDDEVRRLASGLEAAGPDDYVYATAASTPEPHSTGDGSGVTPPPPPPPPPRSSLGHAASGSLGFLQGSAMVAAAAAAAAAAASLNNSGLLLGAGAASPHQMLLMNNEDALLQGSGGLMADTGLCSSSWLNSNSDPSLLTSLTASARQVSATSPVPLPHSAGSRAFRNSLTAAGSIGMMGMSDQAAAAAGSYGLDATSMLATTLPANVAISHQLSGSSASLAAAVNMAGSKTAAGGLVGSAPAGFNMLQGDVSASYQQQLLQQLQLEQQQQANQQQMLQDHLLLQHQLQALIQQQAMVAGAANNAGLQQLVQQQQQQLQQLQLQQQLAAQAQPAQPQVQQWSSSLLASQPLAASAPQHQLLWQQQQQVEPQLNPGSYGSSSSVTPPDGHLAAALAGAGAAASTSRTAGINPAHMATTAPAAFGRVELSQQQGAQLKWSSSILSKQQQQRSSGGASQGGTDGLGRQISSELRAQAFSHGMSGDGGLMRPAAAAAGAVLPSSSSAAAASSLEQLNGLLQMVHVSSSTAMMGPGGL